MADYGRVNLIAAEPLSIGHVAELRFRFRFIGGAPGSTFRIATVLSNKAVGLPRIPTYTYDDLAGTFGANTLAHVIDVPLEGIVHQRTFIQNTQDAHDYYGSPGQPFAMVDSQWYYVLCFFDTNSNSVYFKDAGFGPSPMIGGPYAPEGAQIGHEYPSDLWFVNGSMWNSTPIWEHGTNVNLSVHAGRSFDGPQVQLGCFEWYNFDTNNPG